MSGRLSIDEYGAAPRKLRIDGHLVPIKNYWAVMLLGKAAMLAASDAFSLDSVDPLT